MSHKAIFLDKDGTLVVDVPYNVDPRRIELAPGVATGLKRLSEAGFKLVVVSNQSGVAHGLFGEEALRGVMLRLTELLGEHDVRLDGFYYCPHHPQGKVAEYVRACGCRKPMPGLIERAARDLQIDVARSWMIGDILDDVEAGHRAGCRSVLIDNGNETRWLMNELRRPDYRAADMNAAAQWILLAAENDEDEPVVTGCDVAGTLRVPSNLR
jgi:D-glycero-D-manno-heptose 1,7-bisphosphate phosphatase